jgi:tetratricopeptide (TPR) repeat protein
LLQESVTGLRAHGNLLEIAYSLRRLGYITWALGEYGEARRVYQECHALFHEIGDRAGMAISLAGQARAACGQEAYRECKRLYREGLEMFREIGSLADASVVLGDLSSVANLLGELDEGRRLGQESLDLLVDLDYPIHRAWEFGVLGNAACVLEDEQETKRAFRQALETGRPARAIAFVLLTVAEIAALRMREGKREQTVELLALVLRHPATWQWAKDRAAPLFAALEAELAPELFAAAQERGKARDLDATVRKLLAELDDAQS